MYLRDYSWAAGGFYPTNASEVERVISRHMEGPVLPIGGVDRLVGALAPHAGWAYSGPTAGKVFNALREYSNPGLAVCFGAVHVHGMRQATILPEGEWRTPLGNIPIDAEAAETITKALGKQIAVSQYPHEEEHSLEVILPFLKKCFPNITMAPIMVPPDRNASIVGREVGEALKGRSDVIIIGSTDMTHYGPRFGFSPEGVGPKAVKWVREVNDRRLIDLILDMRDDEIVHEAAQNQSACGAGAIAATVAACRVHGAEKGVLVDYTTSYDVRPSDGGDTFVGYAGVVFG